MTMQRIGGIAALACAGTYLFGFALLVTLLADTGYGTNAIDAADAVRFTVEHQALMITWNTVIYVVNALALAVLVVALANRLKAGSPDWGSIALAFGLIWTTLVLGAGMIANVTTERVAILAATDFEAAVQTWEVLHAVELGLGGGNEIAGGVWILCVSLTGLLRQTFGKGVIALGLLTGLGGLLTILPPLGDVAGAVFGLGAIAWFIAVGLTLLLERDAAAVQALLDERR
jgi:tryptophan-rich sensory protein